MALEQGSALYAGSVSKATIYEIEAGTGLTWAPHFRTETLVDRKPRQLTKAKHAGNPITENVPNPRDADFTGTPTVTIDGRQLTVSELMVKDKIALQEWKETFPEYQPTGNNSNLAANPKVAAAFFNLVMNATKTQINELHSLGDAALIAPNSLRFYDGLITLILADADATQVGTPAVLTASNILDKVYELRSAIEPRLRNKANLKFFCSYADYDLYDIARRKSQTQLAETDLQGSGVLPQSLGSRINIIPIEGIPKDFIFATIASSGADSNLVQGVWVDSEEEVLNVYRSEPADQEIKYVMRFDMGVQYVTGDDIWYLNNV